MDGWVVRRQLPVNHKNVLRGMLLQKIVPLSHLDDFYPGASLSDFLRGVEFLEMFVEKIRGGSETYQEPSKDHSY